jgi:hypothetical protein
MIEKVCIIFIFRVFIFRLLAHEQDDDDIIYIYIISIKMAKTVAGKISGVLNRKSFFQLYNVYCMKFRGPGQKLDEKAIKWGESTLFPGRTGNWGRAKKFLPIWYTSCL